MKKMTMEDYAKDIAFFEKALSKTPAYLKAELETNYGYMFQVTVNENEANVVGLRTIEMSDGNIDNNDYYDHNLFDLFFGSIIKVKPYYKVTLKDNE